MDHSCVGSVSLPCTHSQMVKRVTKLLLCIPSRLSSSVLHSFNIETREIGTLRKNEKMDVMLLQAEVVGVAPTAGQGSQQRRKRKRQQAATAPEAVPLLGLVQWANPAAYRKAFRQATADKLLDVDCTAFIF